jgi:hypothetical protein
LVERLNGIEEVRGSNPLGSISSLGTRRVFEREQVAEKDLRRDRAALGLPIFVGCATRMNAGGLAAPMLVGATLGSLHLRRHLVPGSPPQREQIINGADPAERTGCGEIDPGSDFPEEGPDQRACADEKIADQIISADHLPASLRIAMADNERLARRVAKFLQPTDGKGEREHRKAAR